MRAPPEPESRASARGRWRGLGARGFGALLAFVLAALSLFLTGAPTAANGAWAIARASVAATGAQSQGAAAHAPDSARPRGPASAVVTAGAEPHAEAARPEPKPAGGPTRVATPAPSELDLARDARLRVALQAAREPRARARVASLRRARVAVGLPRLRAPPA
ncbi:MAG: hypothetical protein U0414_24910 [Polyangiaceae bacterium]